MDGEYIGDLGMLSSYLLSDRELINSLKDDIADTDIRVAANRLEDYQDFLYKRRQVPSAPLERKCLSLLNHQVDSLVAKCSEFSSGLVRLCDW